MPVSHKKFDVVDYYDEKKIITGVILEFEDKRLRILNDRGQETKISVGRVLSATSDPGFPVSGSRDQQIARLKALSALREQIREKIDLRELWEVVVQDAGEMSVEDLTELLFGRDRDPNAVASLVRAISEDKVYFKVRPDHVEVIPVERVEQTLSQRSKEEEHSRFINECTAFILRVRTGEDVDVHSAPDGFISLLEDAAVRGKDWVTSKTVRDIFSAAGAVPHLTPFQVLAQLGVWSEDENIRLRAENVPVQFEPEIEQQAMAAARRRSNYSAREPLDVRTVAIDAATTRDVDDALSLAADGEDILVGIHITDVAHFVDHDSPLDLDIRQRAISIYMPEMTIPMIPPALSESAASLAVDEICPAVTISVRMGPDYKVKDFRIFLSLMRLSERISYEEADERTRDSSTMEARLFEVAQAHRQKRISSGAIVFRDPEVLVRVKEDGEIEVTLRDKETPSQITVSELMILANSLFARFMKENNLPGIFRSQPPPSERVELNDTYDPVLSYRARKSMARGDLGLDPAPHSTLALDYYTTATSPLRRYPDLLVQRQLKSFLEKGRPLLDKERLEKILSEISYPIDRAGLLERERHRYFLLKHLQKRRNEEFTAVVLQRFPRFYLVQMEDFRLNAALINTNGLSLKPYDRAIIRIDKINPSEDKLSLALVRLL